MNSRIRKIISRFSAAKIEALLVTQPVNVSYLTESPSCEAWLYIHPSKAYYITDARYDLEFKQILKGISVQCYRKTRIDTLLEIVQKTKAQRIGIDYGHLTLSQYEKLIHLSPKKIKYINANNMVEVLRAVKEKKELDCIKKALEAHKKMNQFLKKLIKPGRTEWDIFVEAEHYVRSLGAAFSFDPILASGPNSCYPHARITPRKIQRDDVVLVDAGLEVGGYKSDLTRMFFLGKIATLISEVCRFVREAQRVAIEKIQSGVPASLIDEQARNYLAKKRLAKYFCHGLGHGIGLEVHEKPRLSQKSPDFLEAGMVVTVEPAVYIPQRFGIRIEDMVLVKQKGCEVLSDDID